MNHFARTKLFVAVAAAGLILTATAAKAQPPASIDWVIQPSTVLTFSGILGTVELHDNGAPVFDENGDPVWLELYELVPQTDAGTSYPVNSMVTSATGTYNTVGNNFLSSLNLGTRPATEDAIANPKVQFANSGNWFPEPDLIVIETPGVYGTATPMNVGASLSQIVGGGGPNGGDGGRVALFGTVGVLSSNNASMPVTVNPAFTTATFDVTNFDTTGSIGIALNYVSNELESGGFAIVAPSTGTVESADAVFSQGYFTRDGADYLMHVDITTPVFDGGLAFLGNLGANLEISMNFVGKANIRPGDVNFDGVVDIADTLTVGANWLQTGAFRPGNANGDGVVDIADVLTIGANWLQTTPPLPGGGAGGPDATPVPEPASMLLLACGLLGLGLLRRRMR